MSISTAPLLPCRPGISKFIPAFTLICPLLLLPQLSSTGHSHIGVFGSYLLFIGWNLSWRRIRHACGTMGLGWKDGRTDGWMEPGQDRTGQDRVLRPRPAQSTGMGICMGLRVIHVIPCFLFSIFSLSIVTYCICCWIYIPCYIMH